MKFSIKFKNYNKKENSNWNECPCEPNLIIWILKNIEFYVNNDRKKKA